MDHQPHINQPNNTSKLYIRKTRSSSSLSAASPKPPGALNKNNEKLGLHTDKSPQVLRNLIAHASSSCLTDQDIVSNHNSHSEISHTNMPLPESFASDLDKQDQKINLVRVKSTIEEEDSSELSQRYLSKLSLGGEYLTSQETSEQQMTPSLDLYKSLTLTNPETSANSTKVPKIPEHESKMTEKVVENFNRKASQCVLEQIREKSSNLGAGTIIGAGVVSAFLLYRIIDRK